MDQRVLGEKQLPVLRHAPEHVQHEDIIHAVVVLRQIFSSRHHQAEVALLAVVPGSNQVQAGLRPGELVGEHQIAAQIANDIAERSRTGKPPGTWTAELKRFL